MLAGTAYYLYVQQVGEATGKSAAHAYKKVINDPCDHILGELFEKDGKYDKAAAIYRKGIEVCHEQDAVLGLQVGLGRVLLKAGQEEEAKRIFNEVLVTVPDNAQAHLGLSFCYLRVNQKNKAVDELKRFVVLASSDDPDRKRAEDMLARLTAEPANLPP